MVVGTIQAARLSFWTPGFLQCRGLLESWTRGVLRPFIGHWDRVSDGGGRFLLPGKY